MNGWVGGWVDLSIPSTTYASFNVQVRSREKALDARCNELHDLYDLIEEFGIEVSPEDRAAYVALDTNYNNLKSHMEEVEGTREENINKYNSSLESGEGCDGRVHDGCEHLQASSPL
jgi:hypothetical protein